MAKEVAKFTIGIERQPSVDWTGLDHGACGRGEPAEPLCLRKLGNGAARGITLRDQTHNPQLTRHGIKIDSGPQRLQPARTERCPDSEEAPRPRVEHDTRVDEFLPFHTWDNADRGISERRP